MGVVAEDTGPRRTRGPSPQKTAQTRNAVTRAALELFLANGYRNTRINDVATRAGVAKGTVYLYFPDKQALFAGVIGEVLDHRVTALAAAEPADGESVRDFLKRTLLPQLTALESNSPWLGLLRLVMTEGREAPEIARLHRERVLDPLAAQIQRWAQIAADRGEVDSDALQRIPLLLLSPAILATLWNGLYPENPINAANAFEGFVDLAFGVPPDPTDGDDDPQAGGTRR
ncbi:MAG: TetR/AcrR family transcriptional regulator [Mycobacterium sp.]|nr:TetR/AcrR family transcriptional regulator [Mycobacterium sp.]